MKTSALVFGEGLLGSAFKDYSDTVVLSKEQCDITHKDAVYDAVKKYSPDTVINCAGIVPKHPASIAATFRTNSFAPHFIADVCHKHCHFIHVSTDCVFSGSRGKYLETDKPDATDIYGMSKILGEPSSGLIVRTSFVGLPDAKGRGLLAWAKQQDEIIGYDNVFWNGVTHRELAKKLLEYAHEHVFGIRHVYSYTVSKYELLNCAKDVFGWTMPIYKETDVSNKPHHKDSTLSSTYATGFITKPIRQQLKELL